MARSRDHAVRFPKQETLINVDENNENEMKHEKSDVHFPLMLSPIDFKSHDRINDDNNNNNNNNNNEEKENMDTCTIDKMVKMVQARKWMEYQLVNNNSQWFSEMFSQCKQKLSYFG